MSSRRHFLRVVAAGGAAAGAGALLGCGNAAGPGGGISGPVDAGNVSALPVGSIHVVSGDPVAVGRDAKGVYALTLICTHAGCDIASSGSVSSTGIDCGCHGSRFDVNGAVLSGPATSPLAHYAVTIASSGDITVDGSTEVDPSTRAAAG